MCLNASIFDMDNGLVIKMAEGQEVVRAMKGFRILSKDEIISVYGSPPIFKAYQWPNTSNITNNRGAYWAFFTYFDIPKVALVLSAVNLKEKGLIPKKSYYDIACDVRTIVFQNYIHFNDKEVKPISTYGLFFPAILKNPLKYIQPQPELAIILTQLRNAGKKLFLATNSHSEYADFIMTTTLGKDWRQYFDIISCYSRKPIFFWDQKVMTPFFELDTRQANFKGKPIMRPEDLKEGGHTYLEGNAKLLRQHFQKSLGKEDVRVAFFGDQYISDVQASSMNKGWDSFAIVEELMFFDMSFADGVDPRLVRYDKYWGSNYFVEY